MKYRWSAWTLVLLFAGCEEPKNPDPIQSSETNVVHHESEGTALKRELDFAFGTAPTNNPLSTAQLLPFDSNAVVYVHHSFVDQLIAMINPESFRKYEGSYGEGEFLARQQNDVPEYSLSSSWIIRNKKLPKAGIKVARNPATGKYEISGGEIFLRKSGVGVSYEEDKGSGETKTFLNLKRDF